MRTAEIRPTAPSPPAPAARSTAGRSRRRQQILEAAIRVFARSGYPDARISDIAREAGSAYGLVYHYFRGKDEILGTIFEQYWSAFLEAVEAIADSPESTEDRLVSIAALVLAAHRLRPDWVKVLVLEIPRSSRFPQSVRRRAVGRLTEAVARLLRDGQARGELRPGVDPEVSAYAYVGGLEMVITARVLDVLHVDRAREHEVYPKVARTLVDVFLRGLGAGGAS